VTPLDEALARGPFTAYVYAYPHKTAYAPIAPRSLNDVWRDEPDGSLFLYAHVPFCAMRCGFCNLFTEAKPEGATIDRYLDALERQVVATRSALRPSARFARVAIGGGTPTFLPPRALDRLFDLVDRARGEDRAAVPIAVETSPETADRERLAVLQARGATRVSIGVQSFDENEVRALGRPQKTAEVHSALRAIREVRGLHTLNIDLIYGIAGQSEQSFVRSIDEALEWRPEELYLYPLYVRPLTGLGRSRKRWDDERIALYRAGRDHLLARDYVQRSMRMFRRASAASIDAPRYVCQADGMIGIGPGARSYTRALHYSFDYAVERTNVRAIIEAFADRNDFDRVSYGFVLDADEQRRRWVVQSLLSDEGLDLALYRARFGTDARVDFPLLGELETRGYADELAGILRASPEGLELSDAIGPAFFSEAVERRMDAWVPK
jgi:oxygen-independent coproporphyrinogen III oxidase